MVSIMAAGVVGSLVYLPTHSGFRQWKYAFRRAHALFLGNPEMGRQRRWALCQPLADFIAYDRIVMECTC